MSEQYFVDLDNKTAGPFTLAELRDLYAGGTIHKETLYAKPGAQDWLPLGTILPLLAAVGLPPITHVKNRPKALPGEFVCKQCGDVGMPVQDGPPGSFLIEVVLWLCFLVPGLIYSIWRLSAHRDSRCPACGSTGMIPVDSPEGRNLTEAMPAQPGLLGGLGRLFGKAAGRLRKT